jgi:hypothetical protein
MADFRHGFVYECDIPEKGMLTIEGVKVEGFERTPDGRRRVSSRRQDGWRSSSCRPAGGDRRARPCDVLTQRRRIAYLRAKR